MARRRESLLSTAADVMDALGGHVEVGKMTGRGYKRAWEWGEDNRFPSRYCALMNWALSRKGLRADPKLWGQVTVPEMLRAA